MSPDSEDSALEEALRADLPSFETSARLRRRLLAAGLAIGNGLAATATTAAAAGATPGVVAGIVGKGLALSWGVKLGALAMVTIPTVGLLVESQAEPELAAPASAIAAPAQQARSPEPAEPEPASAPELAEPEPVAATPTMRVERPADGSTATAPAAPLAPSRVEFESPDAVAAKAASTLAEETRILDSAFAELSAGRAARAAQLVAEHQRRFPNGLLQKERERARARLAEMSRGE